MYGFQKFKFLYLILLAVLVYGFFDITVYADNDYVIGASRQYFNANQHYIIGTGDKNEYDKEYFTGVAFCTGYYYINYEQLSSKNRDISLSRAIFNYDNTKTEVKTGYINKINPSWTTDWKFDISRFGISIVGDSSNLLGQIFTLGRFGFINKTTDSNNNFSISFILPYSSNDYSTYFTNANEGTNVFDSDYAVSIVYYAQPCVPDAPILVADRNTINGIGGSTNTANGALARVPAFHGKSIQNNAGKPITLGTTTLGDTSKFLPGQRNTYSFQNHITFDNGIFIAGIKEPDKNSEAGRSFDQRYWYNVGNARLSGFSLLDTNFVAAPLETTNQRGINPDTIRVTVSFTGVDKTNFGDAGQYCTVVVTGSSLGLSGLGQFSWNRNELGYSVNIDSGTIRSLAHNQCASLSSIAEANIDLKRETVASISWDAYDYSNSMVISQDSNVESYRGPNRITGVTGYDFNNWSDVPDLSMSTDSIDLINSNTVYNIPVNNQNLKFTGTDTYAGINSGTFLIIVTGYNSSIDKSDSRRTSGTPDYNYAFSGSDITKFGFDLENERYDYTGFVDFLGNGTVNTGMHFTVRFEATDFVGNKTIQNYTFRTPTWPNGPKPTGSLIKTAQTRSPIDQIDIIDNILDTDTVDGGGSEYNYSTYYPLHRVLIADLQYISGSNYLKTITDLVLTATNGNVGGTTTVTMTGLTFVYDGSGSYITGTPYVSSGGEAMDDYLATNFTFSILATNIYGITGVIEYTINVAPSCTESPGCTDPVYVFWGTNLADAQSQRTAAIASGTDYLNSNHWYPHWFAQIKQTGPNFYFTGVAGESNAVALYCASTGNELLINYGGYSGPQSNSLSVSPSTFTGNNLTVSGSNVFLFDVFTASVSANYVKVPDNGNDKMTIYVNRPLTGRVFYSVCEFTGSTLDVFGCPVAGNYTGDVNWTRLTSSDQFIMTGWIEGGWFTGNRNGYVTGGSVSNGDQFDFWSTGNVLNGGGTRKYVRTITGDLDQEINTSGSVLFSITNRIGANLSVSHEIYWIDNTSPDLTGYISATVSNQSATLTLSGYNTGVLSTIFTNNLIGDDEYIVTKFSGDVDPSIFENGYGSTTYTGQGYIDGSGSEYKMIHNITFSQDREGQICVEDRAGNESCIEVAVLGIGLHQDLVITIKPAFRPEPTESVTGYAILSGDFWFWVKSGTEWTQNYNSAKNPGTNPKITTNSNGTGIVSIMTPASGAEYLVVFKGSGTLSAGFTGIWADDITELNFFSGDYADTFHPDFVYKYNNGLFVEHYLKVGDISANSTGNYDYIFTDDFALINNNLTVGAFNSPIRYDFDLNSVISSMEQSMILQAWNSHGFIGWLDNQDIIMMDQFIDL